MWMEARKDFGLRCAPVVEPNAGRVKEIFAMKKPIVKADELDAQYQSIPTITNLPDTVWQIRYHFY